MKKCHSIGLKVEALEDVGIGGTMPEGLCVRQTHPHGFYV